MRNLILASSLAALLAAPAGAQCTGMKIEVADISCDFPEKIPLSTLEEMFASHHERIRIYDCRETAPTDADLRPEEISELGKILAPYLERIRNTRGAEQQRAQEEFNSIGMRYLAQKEHTAFAPTTTDYLTHIVLNYISQQTTPGSVVETYIVQKDVTFQLGVAPWMQLAISELAKVKHEGEDFDHLRQRLVRNLELDDRFAKYTLRMERFAAKQHTIQEFVQFMARDPDFRVYQP